MTKLWIHYVEVSDPSSFNSDIQKCYLEKYTFPTPTLSHLRTPLSFKYLLRRQKLHSNRLRTLIFYYSMGLTIEYSHFIQFLGFYDKIKKLYMHHCKTCNVNTCTEFLILILLLLLYPYEFLLWKICIIRKSPIKNFYSTFLKLWKLVP